MQGYAAHYCNLPTQVDPKLVACSFIASGLRVFDISSLTSPKEIAYFVAPTKSKLENGFMASSYAMSQPAFVPERREVWYTDGTSGFYNVRIDRDVWDAAVKGTGQPRCASRRRFPIRVRAPKRSSIRRVSAIVGGKRVRSTRSGRTVRVVVDLRGRPRQAVNVVVRIRLRSGKLLTSRRSYRTCTKRGS